MQNKAGPKDKRKVVVEQVCRQEAMISGANTTAVVKLGKCREEDT